PIGVRAEAEGRSEGARAKPERSSQRFVLPFFSFTRSGALPHPSIHPPPPSNPVGAGSPTAMRGKREGIRRAERGGGCQHGVPSDGNLLAPLEGTRQTTQSVARCS